MRRARVHRSRDPTGGAPRRLGRRSARLTQGFVETECLGAMRVRGFDESVEVHRLVRRTGVVGTWTPRVRATVIDPLVAMVGGEPASAEWAVLDPPRRRRRIRDAVRTVIGEAARRRTELHRPRRRRCPGDADARR